MDSAPSARGRLAWFARHHQLTIGVVDESTEIDRVREVRRMATHRAEVINELAHLIIRESSSTAAVLRVAITGISASGKSILATELVTRINELGSVCVHLPVDGFHNPRSIRYRRGRDSAEGYYRDAYDYDQLIGRALLPLGSPDECWYVAGVFDLDADAPIEMNPIRLDPGSIVILDASFLLRPEVRGYFDYRV